MFKIIRDKSGFTLVEITIVLIIFSLLITGVSAGVAMIERSKIQSVISEFGQITSAVKAFSANYNGHLPGNIPNASDYFLGAAADNCPGGSGDGIISISVSNTDSGAFVESMCAWVHLSLANFLPGDLNDNYQGSYSDVTQEPNSVARRKDIPVSKFSPAAYFFAPYQGVNYLTLGATRSVNGTTGGPIFSQKIASSISSKVAIVDGTVLPLDRSDSILAISEDGSNSGPCHDGIDFYDKSNDTDKVCLLIQSIS